MTEGMYHQQSVLVMMLAPQETHNNLQLLVMTMTMLALTTQALLSHGMGPSIANAYSN